MSEAPPLGRGLLRGVTTDQLRVGQGIESLLPGEQETDVGRVGSGHKGRQVEKGRGVVGHIGEANVEVVGDAGSQWSVQGRPLL